jgi:hypothetical protein
LGPFTARLSIWVTNKTQAGIPFTSEFFRFTAGAFLSLTFPLFGSSFLNLKPEAPTKLVSELEATEEAMVVVSW